MEIVGSNPVPAIYVSACKIRTDIFLCANFWFSLGVHIEVAGLIILSRSVYLNMRVADLIILTARSMMSGFLTER